LPDFIETYDLIGFGSGIYGGKFHEAFHRFVETILIVSPKPYFVFSTCGVRGTQWLASFNERLIKRGFSIVGGFSCKE
jgi:flavodoxin